MADTKFSALTQASGTDLTGTVELGANVAGASKKVSLAQLRALGWIIATDYGAVGDNSTDNTTTLGNAVTAAGSGTLYIPAGTFITGALTFATAGFTLVLAAGATLKAKANTGAGGAGWLNLTAPRITIMGGTLDGNTANQATQYWATVYVKKGTNEAEGCVMRNMRVIGWSGNGVLWECSHTSVLDNVFESSGSGSGTAIQAWDSSTSTTQVGSRVAGNRIIQTTASTNAMGGHANAGSSRFINHTIWENNYIECTRIGLEIFQGCNYNIVRNNKVAVYSMMGLSIADCDYVVCEGNEVITPAAGGDTCAIECGTRWSVYQGNVIHEAAGTQTSWGGFGGYAATSVGNRFIGNVVKGCRQGISLHVDSSYSTIMGNHFEALGPFAGAAVKLNGSGSGTGNIVANNVFLNTVASNADISVNSDNTTIDGNMHVGSTTCVEIGGTITGLRVINNKFSGAVFSGTVPADTVATGNTPNTSDTQWFPVTKKLTADHTLSSATGTKMTDLDTTLAAGTYTFKYSIIMQSSATGTGLAFGLNFSGTAAVRAFNFYYPGTGTAANTGVADDVGASLTGQLMEGNPQTAFSTSTGNMNFTGVATANANILGVVEGVLVVTASGDLQLYHGSEGAVATTVKAGTALHLTRIA